MLQQLGAGGDITYGWNELTGTAPSASGNVGVTLLGNFEYADGVGPFFGFMTLKFASFSTVGTRRDDLGGAVELDVTPKMRGVDIG